MSEQPTSDYQVTKDGVRVRVGQLWRDCDKRMGDRKRYVLGIADGKAMMGISMYDPRPTYVSIKRMHKHSTGWELVAP